MMKNLTSEYINGTMELSKEIYVQDSNFTFILDSLLLSILIVIMLSIGCEISWTKVKYHIKHPVGIGIGMVSQFFIIPLTTYTLLRSCGVKGHHATGVLIISCCCGGILSNVFAYFCDGDLSLSVAMTFLLSLMAMGMTPFNLWIYGNSFETDDLIVPYGRVSLHLAFIVVPIMGGILFRWKFPENFKFFTRMSKYIGFIGIIFCIILITLFFPKMFTSVPRSVRGILLILPPLGLSLGYVLAYSFKQDMSVRKTIATECGIQNVSTVIAIITSSFESEFQASMLLLPWLYTFAVMSAGLVLCLFYQMSKLYKTFKAKKENGFNLEMLTVS